MRTAISFFTVTMFCLLLSSCGFIASVSDMSEKTEQFAESIMQRQYEITIGLMDIDPATLSPALHDTLVAQMVMLHNKIANSFGEQLEYKLIDGERTFGKDKTVSTAPNTTRVYMQMSNGESFGMVTAVFNNDTKKVITFNLLDIKSPVPNMGIFWLFAILGILIPVFNIYVIIKVYKSDMSKKWLRYLAIVILNVPTISYYAVSGFKFTFLNFQILLGYSFNTGGYLSSFVSVGLPIGSLIIWWMLRNGLGRNFSTTVTGVSATNGADTLDLS